MMFWKPIPLVTCGCGSMWFLVAACHSLCLLETLFDYLAAR